MPDQITFTTDPAPEVLTYFRGKGLKPSFNWRDVWGEEHAHAFTVAKAMKLDVLTTLRDAVDKAMADGQTFEQFREELEPKLKSLGWWGIQDQVDPHTGEIIKARLGSPRRLKILYESNLRSAHAAGAWERAQRTKEVLPFFTYQLGPSMVHRPHHVAREGMTYPVDHPIWDTWYPPNGWGCKCWLLQITREEAISRGWYEDQPPPSIPTKTYINRRTGEVAEIPEGIDPGWHTNPGKFRDQNLRAMLSERLEAVPEDLRDIALHDNINSWLFRKLHAGELGDDITAPLAVVSPELAASLGTNRRLLWVTGKTLAAADGVSLAEWAEVQKVISQGRVVRQRGALATVEGEVAGANWTITIGRPDAASTELRLLSFTRSGAVEPAPLPAKRAPEKPDPYTSTNGARTPKAPHGAFTADDEAIGSIKLAYDAIQEGRASAPAWAKGAATEAEFGARWRVRLAELARDRELKLHKRTTVEAFEKIIESGRIKTQFETGTSKGILDNDLRAEVERKLFDIPEHSLRKQPHVRKRPIYGYLGRDNETPSYELGYGTVRITFKDSVRPRTTFTGDDSLGAAFRPSPINAPDPRSIGAVRWHEPGKGIYAEKFEDAFGPYHSYIETQIHGGAGLDDIEKVTFGHPAEIWLGGARDATISWELSATERGRLQNIIDKARKAGLKIEITARAKQAGLK